VFDWSLAEGVPPGVRVIVAGGLDAVRLLHHPAQAHRVHLAALVHAEHLA